MPQKEKELQIAKEIYFATNEDNAENRQKYENEILPKQKDMSVEDLHNSNEGGAVILLNSLGYNEALSRVPSGEAHFKEIEAYRAERDVYINIYTTYNDDNLLHCENSFYSNGYQTFTAEQLHEVNKDFLREVMKQSTTPEEILQYTPNTKEHLQEVLAEQIEEFVRQYNDASVVVASKIDTSRSDIFTAGKCEDAEKNIFGFELTLSLEPLRDEGVGVLVSCCDIESFKEALMNAVENCNAMERVEKNKQNYSHEVFYEDDKGYCEAAITTLSAMAQKCSDHTREQQGKTVEQPITNKSLSEKENVTMANGWNNPKTQEQANEKPAQAQEMSLAYIHKDTREAAKSNEVIDNLANATLELAKAVMDKVQEEGKTFEKTTKDGSKTYTASMAVKVEPATDYKTGEPITYQKGDRAGEQVYKATAEINNKGTTLTLFASQKEDKTVELTSMVATRWNNKENKMGYYKQADIQSAYINADIKAVADVVERSGLLHEKADRGNDKSSTLASVAVEANKYFAQVSEQVMSTDESKGLVNDAYAQYKKDDYGEKVELHAHTDNIVVELFEDKNGKPSALAVNYDVTVKTDDAGKAYFAERQDGDAPAKAFINNAEDLKAYVANSEISEVIANFKGFEMEKEKSKEADKKREGVEKD